MREVLDFFKYEFIYIADTEITAVLETGCDCCLERGLGHGGLRSLKAQTATLMRF